MGEDESEGRAEKWQNAGSGSGALVAEVRECGSQFFEFLKMKTEPGLGAKPGFEEWLFFYTKTGLTDSHH